MSRKHGPVETPEYGKMILRMIRAYGRRVANADEIDLAQMIGMRDAVDQAIADAVRGQRENYGRSWAYIATGLGTTRQAAQMRYGRREQLDPQFSRWTVTGETDTHLELVDEDGNTAKMAKIPPTGLTRHIELDQTAS